MRKHINIFMPMLLTILLILCAGCSARSTTPTPQEPHAIYKLQHSAVLSIADKRISMRGMLQLIPQEKRAKVVMLNDMGMKLLIAEIRADKEDGFTSNPIFISPFLRAIPNFYKESMRCIYATYFAETTPETITNFSLKKDGVRLIGDRSFPEHTIIKNTAKNYTLELFLNSGSQVGS